MTIPELLDALDDIVRDCKRASDQLMLHAPPASTAMQRAMMAAHDAQRSTETVRERLQMEGLQILTVQSGPGTPAGSHGVLATLTTHKADPQ